MSNPNLTCRKNGTLIPDIFKKKGTLKINFFLKEGNFKKNLKKKILFLFEGSMKSWMFFLGEEKIRINFLNSLK